MEYKKEDKKAVALRLKTVLESIERSEDLETLALGTVLRIALHSYEVGFAGKLQRHAVEFSSKRLPSKIPH